MLVYISFLLCHESLFLFKLLILFCFSRGFKFGQFTFEWDDLGYVLSLTNAEKETGNESSKVYFYYEYNLATKTLFK